mgnify:CR=1 FL=1
MSVPFSELPGRHERHYRRRLDNPLFAQPLQFSEQDLLEAQRLDHEELMTFITDLRAVVTRAIAFKPNEETEVVLQLKEDLERLYETSAGLADEQQQHQQAIAQLLEVVMGGIARNAHGDSLAEQELEMEAQARALHFELLQTPLVADLLHPHSLISEEQLVATLLTESVEAVGQVVNLFDQTQRQALFDEAGALLQVVDPQQQMIAAREVLKILAPDS